MNKLTILIFACILSLPALAQTAGWPETGNRTRPGTNGPAGTQRRGKIDPGPDRRRIRSLISESYIYFNKLMRATGRFLFPGMYLCTVSVSRTYEPVERHPHPADTVEHRFRTTRGLGRRDGRSHADRGRNEPAGGPRHHLQRLVVRPATITALREFHADRPEAEPLEPAAEGSVIAALRIRRHPRRSFYHAHVGRRRLHAHPRGRNRPADDDSRPQSADVAVFGYAEPVHTSSLPRFAKPVFV